MTSRKRAKADPEMALVKLCALLVRRIDQTGLAPANKWLVYEWSLERLAVSMNKKVGSKWKQHIEHASEVAKQGKKRFELSLNGVYLNLPPSEEDLERWIQDVVREKSQSLGQNAREQLPRIKNRRLRLMCERALSEATDKR